MLLAGIHEGCSDWTPDKNIRGDDLETKFASIAATPDNSPGSAIQNPAVRAGFKPAPPACRGHDAGGVATFS
jgi:hypothetical protein